jgi:hypothetical protein
MRLLFVISLTSFVAAAATFACSSGDSAATPADAGKDAKAVVKTGDDDDDKPTTTDPPSTPTDSGTDPDATGDGGTGTPGGDLTTTGDGGTACDTESFREAETNNTAETANKLAVKDGTTKICGQVTSTDPDFITFKMPADATQFFVTPGGSNFKISGTIDGQPFDGFNFNGIQVNQGATWIVKVETGSTEARAWRLAFKFQ